MSTSYALELMSILCEHKGRAPKMMGFPYEHLKRTGMHERFQAHANTILQDLGVQTSFAIDACMHQGGRRPVPEDLGVAAYPLCLHHLFGGKLGDRRRKCPLWSGCSSSRLRHLFGVELVAEVENASCQVRARDC
eukprot:1157473-Pelagomonas_calceolata.AAC.9